MSLTANGPTSASTSSLCVVCHAQPSKYTCPRCHTKTCSASCSARHKITLTCSGVRDRVGYVPMNSYGWGAMMDDYVFLEDVGRVVEAQGSLIARDGLTRGVRGRGRGRGHNDFNSRQSGAAGKSKREILQMQLGFRNIKMDLLPEGMQRQRSNTSRFDNRDNAIILTCEIVLYAPYFRNPPKSEAGDPSTPFRFIIHQNSITASLRDIVFKHLTKIQDSHSTAKNSKDSLEKLPSWVQWYIHGLSEAPSGMPDNEREDEYRAEDRPSSSSFRVLLPEYPPRPLRRPQPNLGIFAPTTTSIHDTLRPYHLINLTDSLQANLRNKGFLEFPTFVFVPNSNDPANDAVILVEDIPEDGVILRDRKRRRIEDAETSVPSPPTKRVGAMLGGYSSDDETHNPRLDNPIGLLGGYESDGSDPPVVDEPEDESGGEDGNDNDRATGQTVSANLVSPIFAEVPLASRWLPERGDGDEEAIDWGEEDGE